MVFVKKLRNGRWVTVIMTEENFKDREIAEALTKAYYPINRNLLNRWSGETKNGDLKKAIKQWIEILDQKRGSIDLDLYEKLDSLRKEVV